VLDETAEVLGGELVDVGPDIRLRLDVDVADLREQLGLQLLAVVRCVDCVSGRLAGAILGPLVP
jgi:hypothetical protein